MKAKPLAHPPISLEGFAGCLLYLALAIAGKTPDPSLLLCGLPHGGILRAEVQHDPYDGSVMIAVWFLDQQEPTRKRKPRLLDPLGFLVLRLLMTAATLLRIDRSEKQHVDPPRKERHRIVVHGNLILYRVLADVRPGQNIHQFIGHYDLRRGSITKFTEQAVRAAGRSQQRTALERTLAAFDRYPPHHLPIERESLERLLEEAFALLNKLPLAKTSS